MVRRYAFALVAMFIMSLASGSVLRAHEGHGHRIMGTVTMAAADHVMVEDRQGKAVTVKVTKETRVKSKPAMKVDEIAPGTRVVITATQEKDKSFTATAIEVGSARADGK
jgi:Domain of unknown function (DUF5666)